MLDEETVAVLVGEVVEAEVGVGTLVKDEVRADVRECDVVKVAVGLPVKERLRV